MKAVLVSIRLFRASFFIGAFLVSMAGHATLEQPLRELGLLAPADQADQVIEQWLTSSAQQPALNDAEVSQLRQDLHRYLGSEVLHEALLSYLQQHISPSQLQALQQMPAGRCEQLAEQPLSIPLPAQPPMSAARARQLRQLDQLNASSALAAQVQQGIVETADFLLARQRQQTATVFSSQRRQADLAQRQQWLQQQLLSWQHYSLRELSEAELDACIQTWASPQRQALLQLVQRAVNQALMTGRALAR